MDGNASELLKWITEAKRIEVPFFQRPYVWNETDFEALIDSFNDAVGNTMPFFGSVIMKKVGSDEDLSYLVIDGQQRITTFNILIRVLLDINENNDIKLAPAVTQTLRNAIYDIDVDDEGGEVFYLRLIPSNSDKESFEKVMEAECDRPIALESLTNAPIEIAYSFFYKYFTTEGVDAVKKFSMKLFNHNKSMIFIVLDDKDDEQRIFDSVNSLGKALTNSDIIKNYIFQKLKEKAFEDEHKIKNILVLYNKYWDSIFYKEDRKTFWYKEFSVGRNTTDHLECFLRDFAIAKKIYSAYKATGTYGLCNTYKNYIDVLNYDQLVTFLKEINEYAQVYYEYKSEYANLSNYIWSDYKNRLLLIFDRLETTTFNPYLLKLLKEKPNDIEQKFYRLERFFMKRFIFGGPTSNYNKCCEGLISAIDDAIYFDEYMKESPVPNVDYKIKLRRCNNTQGLLVMFLIEMMNRDGNETMYSDALNIKAYTLEHVMPQKWNTNNDWMNIDSYNDEGELIDKNNTQLFVDNRNEAVRSIGNFALLTSKLNTSISNGSFAIKINGNGKPNGSGIRQFAAALSTTRKVIDVFDSNELWDERKIFENEKNYYNQLNNYYHFQQ